MVGHVCRSSASLLQPLKIQRIWLHPRGWLGTDQATRDCSWRKQGKALVLPSLLFQQKSWGCLFPSAWVLISTSSTFQHLPPSNQVQLLLYISLNLLFSQPLLPIKLDIRTVHQLVLFWSRGVCFWPWMLWLGWTWIFLQNYSQALCFHLFRCSDPIALPQKTLNSLGGSQQKNPMLLSLGIAIALYVLSSGGDPGSVCVYDHFIILSSKD